MVMANPGRRGRAALPVPKVPSCALPRHSELPLAVVINQNLLSAV